MNFIVLIFTNPIAFVVAWLSIYCVTYTFLDYVWPTEKRKEYL